MAILSVRVVVVVKADLSSVLFKISISEGGSYFDLKGLFSFPITAASLLMFAFVITPLSSVLGRL